MTGKGRHGAGLPHAHSPPPKPCSCNTQGRHRAATSPQDDFSPRRLRSAHTQKPFLSYAWRGCRWFVPLRIGTELENASCCSPPPSPTPLPTSATTPVPDSPLLHRLELKDHLGFGILRVLPFVAVTWYNHHITHRDAHFGIRHLSHEAHELGGKQEGGAGLQQPPEHRRLRAKGEKPCKHHPPVPLQHTALLRAGGAA